MLKGTLSKIRPKKKRNYHQQNVRRMWGECISLNANQLALDSPGVSAGTCMELQVCCVSQSFLTFSLIDNMNKMPRKKNRKQCVSHSCQTNTSLIALLSHLRTHLIKSQHPGLSFHNHISVGRNKSAIQWVRCENTWALHAAFTSCWCPTLLFCSPTSCLFSPCLPS